MTMVLARRKSEVGVSITHPPRGGVNIRLTDSFITKHKLGHYKLAEIEVEPRVARPWVKVTLTNETSIEGRPLHHVGKNGIRTLHRLATKHLPVGFYRIVNVETLPNQSRVVHFYLDAVERPLWTRRSGPAA